MKQKDISAIDIAATILKQKNTQFTLPKIEEFLNSDERGRKILSAIWLFIQGKLSTLIAAEILTEKGPMLMSEFLESEKEKTIISEMDPIEVSELLGDEFSRCYSSYIGTTGGI